MALATKTALGIAAGVCGTLFLGYCVYFDHKRRSDPNFKRKLKNKRKQAKLNKGPSTVIPDLKDADAVQAFFLREVQLGEEELANGNVEGGVEHLCAAIAVCGQPQQLLRVLQQTLPRPIFCLLLERLPLLGQRIISQGNQQQILLAEDELE
ncbi:mitochondrial import receptor subunit TOM20 homolog [Hetaerina americana]|uniref:mitochondrial import receptor subunit TOM20 homolog n=1 Tax=Hetaerina americana TaxID=62018 RepID=UPI003A7F579E